MNFDGDFSTVTVVPSENGTKITVHKSVISRCGALRSLLENISAGDSSIQLEYSERACQYILGFIYCGMSTMIRDVDGDILEIDCLLGLLASLALNNIEDGLHRRTVERLQSFCNDDSLQILRRVQDVEWLSKLKTLCMDKIGPNMSSLSNELMIHLMVGQKQLFQQLLAHGLNRYRDPSKSP
jgi:hypothetical protein